VLPEPVEANGIARLVLGKRGQLLGRIDRRVGLAGSRLDNGRAAREGSPSSLGYSITSSAPASAVAGTSMGPLRGSHCKWKHMLPTRLPDRPGMTEQKASRMTDKATTLSLSVRFRGL
jgi:hypothetical protein